MCACCCGECDKDREREEERDENAEEKRNVMCASMYGIRRREMEQNLGRNLSLFFSFFQLFM